MSGTNWKTFLPAVAANACATILGYEVASRFGAEPTLRTFVSVVCGVAFGGAVLLVDELSRKQR